MKQLIKYFICVIGAIAMFELLFWLHGLLQNNHAIDLSGVSTLTVWATVLTVVFLVFAIIGLLNIENRIRELNKLKEQTENTHREMREQLSDLKTSAKIERQKIVEAAEQQITNMIERSVDFQTLHDVMSQIATFPNPVDKIKHYTDLLHSDTKINNINRCLILSRRGESYEVLGRFEEAVNDYKSAIKEAPKHPEGYIMLGNLLAVRKKDYKGSIEYFEKALELDPSRTLMYGNIANSYSALGEYDKAQEYYQKMRDYNIETPDYYYNQTIQDRKAGLPDADGRITEGYLLKCLRINPLFTPAIVNLSNLYGSHGNYEKALELIDKTISRTADDEFVKIIIQRAMAKKNLNLPALAAVDFLWADAIKPNDVFVLTSIAECKAQSGSMSEAAQFASMALKEGHKQGIKNFEQINHHIISTFEKMKEIFDANANHDETNNNGQ